VADELDDFVGAVAEDEVRRFDTKFLRQLTFQVERVAVGVKVKRLDCLLHCSDGGG
jgi:hypothetical protein